ncbi:hypothetical protein C6361_26715 [Plantactinospora sp. BC1]|nr:hypothetical protein C6361_26715 [Plantactinospora sp. BC1]
MFGRQDDRVDRAGLTALLDAETGEAYESCRAALRAGADLRIFEGVASAGDLLRIYRRRERHTRARGVRTMGSAEAVSRMAVTDLDELQLGRVAGPELRWSYWFFLAPGGSRLVACLAIQRRTHLMAEGM